MTAYYNEIDPAAAAWLRELIKHNLIAPGDVDERSIEDVTAADLMGYDQCHFFAGVGIWSHALRLSGIPDDFKVWTGSCPCQPFSAAGKGEGFADERHLWPAFGWLIQQCRPERVFGEQVAGKDGLAWLDLVSADMEALGYSVGAVPFAAAGIGAPHIRERLYWVADAASLGRIGWRASQASAQPCAQQRPDGLRAVGGVADVPRGGWREERSNSAGVTFGDRTEGFRSGSGNGGSNSWAGAADTFWSDADWLGCRDGRWRPVEARPQPLADGSAVSLGRVCDQSVSRIEEEIDAWSVESQIERASALRTLQETLGKEAGHFWTAGGLPGLHEAPFLLSFMRQLEEQGWQVQEGIALSCSEDAARRVRVLRDEQAPSGASCERGLVGQPAGKLADPLHLLSSLLARHAHQAWADAYEAYAEVGLPLGKNAPARKMRLKGYGNGLVAQQAQSFIESYTEVRSAQ